MKRSLSALAVSLFLASCSPEHRAALKYAEDQAKIGFDTEAGLLIQAPCAMNVGSYWRALNNAQRSAVDILCGK